MPTYVITNRAPRNYVGSEDDLASWNAWFDRLGDNLLDRCDPVFDRSTLGNCEPETDLGGYTLVTADNLESALALAEECPVLAVGGPVLAVGGGVEVGELTLLNSGRQAFV